MLIACPYTNLGEEEILGLFFFLFTFCPTVDSNAHAYENHDMVSITSIRISTGSADGVQKPYTYERPPLNITPTLSWDFYST